MAPNRAAGVLVRAGLTALFAFSGGAHAAATEKSYDAARWDPIHFKPAIDKASNEQCLACHREILDHKVRASSPSGFKAADALAWYQRSGTYEGSQETFHARHLTTPYARKVMTLKCIFCHEGNDPREEAPNLAANSVARDAFTLRKTVNPSTSCLMCHGRFPFEYMAGVEGPWPLERGRFEVEGVRNGCLMCHESLFRTVRHQVNYLKPDAIEREAVKGSDVCHGCHGGRAWYRVSYPYPRNAWRNMGENVPEWARGRPTHSDPRHLVKPAPANAK